MKVSVTGANGLVGRALRQRIEDTADLSGRYADLTSQHAGDVISPDLSNCTSQDWQETVAGCDVLVHLAAALPWTSEGRSALTKINVDGTRVLAQAAARSGVKRIVFVSTLGVHGITSGDAPFNPNSPIQPSGEYAETKHEAEVMLHELCAETEMELVILRPPVVYGAGVGGKIGMLADRISKGKRLPFGRIQSNRRQMIGADNLADAILLACSHPHAPGSVILPSDAEAVSTYEFTRLLAQGCGFPVRFAPLPEALFRFLKPLPVVGGIAERLIGNVEITDPHLRQSLGWSPPLSLQEGVAKMYEGKSR